MTKMKSLHTLTAKDMLISRAAKLPDRLLLDAVNEHGLFSASFLLRLNEEQLSDLRKESEKQNGKEFFLSFYSISEEKAGKESPCEVKDFTNFDYSKVVSISFNGNTVPMLPYRDWEPIYYVSVTFVLKD